MTAAIRVRPASRAEFRWFAPVTTRWHDNDVFGHVNNVIYYSWIDTTVNRWLIESAALNQLNSPLIGLVAETGCTYFESIAFPEAVETGLAARKIGASSVEYRIGTFKAGADKTAALGRFVHVYVDFVSRRPVALPDLMRQKLSQLLLK